MTTAKRTRVSKLAAVLLLAGVAVVYGRACYHAYVRAPQARVAKGMKVLEGARKAYQLGTGQPPGYFLPPSAPSGVAPLEAGRSAQEYVATGSEQAKQEYVRAARAAARQEHRLKMVLSLAVACLSVLIAVGLALSLRQTGNPSGRRRPYG